MRRANTKLEEELNLMPVESVAEPKPITEEETAITITDRKTLLSTIDKIEAALPEVTGLDATDAELDELAAYARKSAEDLMDLSLNVESKFVGEIASAAGTMLGHAVNARANKIKKKLELISLQIKKQVADQKAAESDSNQNKDQPLAGDSYLLDRREVLERLLGQKNS